MIRTRIADALERIGYFIADLADHFDPRRHDPLDTLLTKLAAERKSALTATQTLYCLWCGTHLSTTGKSESAVKAEMMAHEQHCEANPLHVRIKELEADVADAKALSVKLREMKFTEQDASMLLEGDGAAFFVKLLAGLFVRFNGTNNVEWIMGGPGTTVETADFYLSMQKKSGLTPAQQRDRYKKALEAAHDYLNSALRPCRYDCECILHDIEAALDLPTSRGVK